LSSTQGRIVFRPSVQLADSPRTAGGRSVREVRIIPAHNARFFAVEFVATNIGPVDQPSLDQNRIPGIDPGVNNLAACAATTG